ncbi:hypothetical protein BH10PSE10_BH10PSE10_00900 [soil metagenome]
MQSTPESSADGRSAWLQAGSLLLVSSVVIAALSLQPRSDADTVAAIFPPWWSAKRAMQATAAAGASVIRTGVIPSIMVVQPAHDDGLTKLRAAGAWFAMDPRAVAACFSGLTTTRSEGSGA